MKQPVVSVLFGLFVFSYFLFGVVQCNASTTSLTLSARKLAPNLVGFDWTPVDNVSAYVLEQMNSTGHFNIFHSVATTRTSFQDYFDFGYQHIFRIAAHFGFSSNIIASRITSNQVIIEPEVTVPNQWDAPQIFLLGDTRLTVVWITHPNASHDDSYEAVVRSHAADIDQQEWEILGATKSLQEIQFAITVSIGYIPYHIAHQVSIRWYSVALQSTVYSPVSSFTRLPFNEQDYVSKIPAIANWWSDGTSSGHTDLTISAGATRSSESLAYLKFDLSQLSDECIIDRARMSLFFTQQTFGTLYIHTNFDESWSEDSTEAAKRPLPNSYSEHVASFPITSVPADEFGLPQGMHASVDLADRGSHIRSTLEQWKANPASNLGFLIRYVDSVGANSEILDRSSDNPPILLVRCVNPCELDQDQDGVVDCVDNCPNQHNPRQRATDCNETSIPKPPAISPRQNKTH